MSCVSLVLYGVRSRYGVRIAVYGLTALSALSIKVATFWYEIKTQYSLPTRHCHSRLCHPWLGLFFFPFTFPVSFFCWLSLPNRRSPHQRSAAQYLYLSVPLRRLPPPASRLPPTAAQDFWGNSLRRNGPCCQPNGRHRSLTTLHQLAGPLRHLELRNSISHDAITTLSLSACLPPR